MTKLRAVIMSGVLCLMATVIMSFMYIFSNVSYSYVPNEFIASNEIVINNIEVLKGVDPYRVDGPNIVGNDINLDVDLKPYETYKFQFDIVNKTSVNYVLSKVGVNCLNDAKVNDYLTVDMRYEDGTLVTDNTLIPDGVKRIVTVTVSYNKNVSGTKTFNLNFDMNYDVTNMR